LDTPCLTQVHSFQENAQAYLFGPKYRDLETQVRAKGNHPRDGKISCHQDLKTLTSEAKNDVKRQKENVCAKRPSGVEAPR
jgi:hypothetical protein